ncbi:hypothetical protein C5167_044767 [Papaver somniferum]|nr:hypothetical protein C5167_044767 [Papaver somniferum]
MIRDSHSRKCLKVKKHPIELELQAAVNQFPNSQNKKIKVLLLLSLATLQLLLSLATLSLDIWKSSTEVDAMMQHITRHPRKIITSKLFDIIVKSMYKKTWFFLFCCCVL